MKLAIVKWKDAFSSNTWSQIQETPDEVAPDVYTVGWEYQNDANGVCLMATIAPEHSDGLFGQMFFIPRGMVEKVIYVGSEGKYGLLLPKNGRANSASHNRSRKRKGHEKR
jgi:hypothetical protein